MKRNCLYCSSEFVVNALGQHRKYCDFNCRNKFLAWLDDCLGINNRRAWRKENKRKLRAKSANHEAHVKLWVARCEQIESIRRKNTRLHDAHVKSWKSEKRSDYFNHRYRTDPEFNAYQKTRARLRKLANLDGRLSADVATYAKKQLRNRKAWGWIVDYSMAELCEHLKRTLPKGRTWDEFLSGDLHIDHIVPRSAFDLNNPDDVRACWSLSNLRLLDARENIQKKDKIEYLI